jgi:hypothetical protein
LTRHVREFRAQPLTRRGEIVGIELRGPVSGRSQFGTSNDCGSPTPAREAVSQVSVNSCLTVIGQFSVEG